MFHECRRLAAITPACCLLLAGCSSLWELSPQVVRKDIPHYPEKPDLDYDPLPCMAHAACPLVDESTGEFRGINGRIWLKGSAAFRSATVPCASSPVRLDPPYYTAVVEAPPGKTTVEFSGEDGSRRRVEVIVPDPRWLNKAGDDFSILFFGDLQPFALSEQNVFLNPGDGTNEPGRKEGKLPVLVEIRKLLRAAAEGKAGKFLPTSMIIGHGDQVYVEGAYEHFSRYGHSHPMSAWTMEAQPRPRVSAAAFPAFLDACYRGTWSLSTMDGVFRTVPSVLVWDDHDIRDGWGSQGDEHVYRDTYFRIAREAYGVHQIQRGPRGWPKEFESMERSLYQAFHLKGIPVFLLDERNDRDVSVPAVLGAEQWRVLRAWFARLDPKRSPYYVLVSSVPIFYRVAERANIAASFSDEIRDDLLDTWTSEPNAPEWKELVNEIVIAWERGLRAIIVSGDYHMSSVCRITARTEAEPKVVAYEIITSGLAAEAYGGWKQKMGRDGLFMDDPIEIRGRMLDCEFGHSDTLPNFGGIEFVRGEPTVSIFETTEEGSTQYKVPLQWEGQLQDFEDLTERAERPISVP